MKTEEIRTALGRLGVTGAEVAEVLGKDRTVGTKLLNGTRGIHADEVPTLLELIRSKEVAAGELLPTASLPEYVHVEVLPTHAGMGGGGTGEGEVQMALLPRRLVEDELRAKPADLLVINVRGDSMEPDFFHGDQILIDRRDTNPVQPGPFALWDGDGYVVKNVERKSGRYRIFSSNTKYSDDFADPEEVNIMGRPAWFARRV